MQISIRFSKANQITPEVKEPDMNTEVMNEIEEIKEDSHLDMIAGSYTKEELVQKMCGQFTQTQMLMEILRILVNEAATGSDRSQARERGRLILASFDEATEAAYEVID